MFQFSSVTQSCLTLCDPMNHTCQASLSITNSRSSLRLTSIQSVMPSSHLILCRPPFLLPPIAPSIRVFSNESTLRMRWPKYWSFSFSIIPLYKWHILRKTHFDTSLKSQNQPFLLPKSLKSINSFYRNKNESLTLLMIQWKIISLFTSLANNGASLVTQW